MSGGISTWRRSRMPIAQRSSSDGASNVLVASATGNASAAGRARPASASTTGLTAASTAVTTGRAAVI